MTNRSSSRLASAAKISLSPIGLDGANPRAAAWALIPAFSVHVQEIPGLLVAAIIVAHIADRITKIISIDQDCSLCTDYLAARIELFDHV